MRTRLLIAGLLLAGVVPVATATTQQSARGAGAIRDSATSLTSLRAAPALDALIAHALAVSPALHAAMARVDAARARVGPTSTLPDPMLMLGIINEPLGTMAVASTTNGTMPTTAGPEPMTMRMIGVSQRMPYPGKLSLQRRSAEYGVEASQASLDAARRQLIRDVKVAFYEIAFIDQARTIVERNGDVLTGLIAVSESRYSVGAVGQQDVLKARVEATRLAETAALLSEQRVALVAQLNALLDQPSEAPVSPLMMPEAIARAAVPASSDAIHFTSNVLGSRAADSPLRSLAELQEAAIRESPEIREHLAALAAQSMRVELARKDYLPDIDLSLQYGQRAGGLPDMISATVSVPIPIFKGRKQDQQVAEATAQLAALEGDHHRMVNTIRGEVARLVSEIERERTQLALVVKAILPQGRAALVSATANYQVGKTEFLAVLENQSTVFNYETEYFRVLTDFASKVAELERVVGGEVLK